MPTLVIKGKITKDYRLASKAEYNFIDFFINKISKVLKLNLFSRKNIFKAVCKTR